MIAPETARAVGELARALFAAFERHAGYRLDGADFEDSEAIYWMEQIVDEVGVAELIDATRAEYAADHAYNRAKTGKPRNETWDAVMAARARRVAAAERFGAYPCTPA